MKGLKTKIMIVVLCLAMITSIFAGCIEQGKPGGETVTPSAPVATIDGDVLSWNVTDGAENYKVYIDGNLSATTIGTKYSLSYLPEGNYSIEVTVTVSGKESNRSKALAYEVNKQEEREEKLVYNDVVNAEYSYDGIWQKVTDTVVDRQLLDRSLWADFVNQFRSATDDETRGWRGEFWGKLMIGACLTYEQTGDEELYEVLLETVKDMLTTQDEDGRISTYKRLSEDPDCNEFYGWDMWCRKYVLMGMESFYDICKDEEFKQTLVESMLAQVDYMLKYIGDDKDFIITDTGIAFGGLASSSILEGIVKLYNITGEQRVLDFATHIVNCGGSSINNQIEMALANTSLPYTWGTPKAYELTSFFDGVMDYYLATGITKYKTAAVNYAYAVLSSEVTVTGGAGYNSEEFNNSVREQANPTNTKANLETCVTVSLIRFFYKVYKVTGDIAFIDCPERTMYNALIGAVDLEGYFDHAFTSYFNLVYSTKISSSAGGMHMVERDYGCCIAYGASGTGLIHRLQYMSSDDGINVNLYLAGEVSMETPSGNRLTLETKTNYPYSDTIEITVSSQEEDPFCMNLRIPEWSENTVVAINGNAIGNAKAGEYCKLYNNWKNGDKITIKLDMKSSLYYGSEECANPDAQYNVAVLYGPLVLARDARLDGGNIYQTVNFVTDENGRVELTPSSTADFYTMCEFETTLADGTVIHLIDYASAGKTYDEESLMSVFLPTTDYWNEDIDLSEGVILECVDDTVIMTLTDGKLGTGPFRSDFELSEELDINDNKFTFIDRGNGKYSMHFTAHDSALCIGVADDGSSLVEEEYSGSEDQLFELKRAGLYYFKIVAYNGALISETGDGSGVHLYSEANSTKQKWLIYA